MRRCRSKDGGDRIDVCLHVFHIDFLQNENIQMCAAAIHTKRMAPVPAIAVACGAGARDCGCKDGPVAFQHYWARKAGSSARLAWEPAPGNLYTEIGGPVDVVARTGRWLAWTTRRLTQRRERFLVIGGDHSCAIGTWVGAAEGLRAPLGLVWIDAHMDMHVPETSPSGSINGMALAALIGCGAPELTALSYGRGAIAPRNVCLIGARSFELEEAAFAKRHGIRVIGMDELHRRGIADACAEARAIAATGVAGYGVSLDLDVFDPADAPGVGTPARGGIRPSEFLDAWSDLTRSALCVGVEIVEYNPHRDQAGRTAQLLGELVAATVGEEKLQWAS
jgi:arginase